MAPWCCCCLVSQSCLTLCDPMDCSPPGSFVHGILQARILEWVAIPSCRGSSWPRDWTHVSCIGGRMLYHWATWEAPIQPPRRKKRAGDARGPPSLVPWIVWAPQEGPQHLHPPGPVSPAPALLLLLLPLLFGAQQSCWSRLNCFVGKQVSPLGVPVWPPQPALPALASPILDGQGAASTWSLCLWCWTTSEHIFCFPHFMADFNHLVWGSPRRSVGRASYRAQSPGAHAENHNTPYPSLRNSVPLNVTPRSPPPSFRLGSLSPGLGDMVLGSS